MSRKYAVTIVNGSFLAADTDIDIWELVPAANKPVTLHGFRLGQLSEIKDAEEELLPWEVLRGHTTGGSGGTTITPRPMHSSLDTAAGFAAEVVNDVVATLGTTHSLGAGTFNVRTGDEFWWTPEFRPECSAAETSILIRMEATVTDNITGIYGVLYVEEHG